MKFCKDCKFKGSGYAYMWCQHPNNGTNLVSGESNLVPAITNRESKFLCGKEARWFEPKPKEIPAKPWYKFWSK
jgi:hypothetical protein